jgi:hypothetical protein
VNQLVLGALASGLALHVATAQAQSETFPLVVDLQAKTVGWEDVDGEVSYRVSGGVQYIPANVCDLPQDQVRTESVTIAAELPEDSTSFVLPPPVDPTNDAINALTIDVQAINEAGESIAVGGYGINAEVGLCPPDNVSAPLEVSLPSSGSATGDRSDPLLGALLTVLALAMVTFTCLTVLRRHWRS